MQQKTRQLLDALGRDQVLGMIPSGLFLVDRDRHVVYWNREAERITGYPAADALGRHCSFLEGIECGRGCGLFDADAPPKPIIGAECRIRTRSGQTIVIAKNVDFLLHDGAIVGGIETFIDITSQKRLEETLRRQSGELEQTVRERTVALEEERNRLRSVLDAMSDPAYIVTTDYRIDYCNQAMQKIFHPGPGRRCHDVIHGRHEVCPACPWPEIRSNRPLREERVFGQNGRTYEIVHTPVHSPQGDIQKLAVCRDITERAEAAEKLKELNRHLDSFVYTVSHDLRSPLTPIIGFAEFLREEYRGKLDDQGISLLREIENQGGRMMRLMEDLLNLSRVGHLPPAEEPVDLNAVVEQLVQDNRLEIEAKQARVTVRPLPELLIPETLLSEIFGNLLINALRYGCPSGGEIEIGAESDAAGHSLYVTDHGPGIPEREREKVCNVFYRGSTAGDSSGTGIGLATVHKIVRLYDGTLRFEETPGGGCTVRIHLPAG